jgi:hypothetical protein
MTDSMSRPEIVYEKTWQVMADDVLRIEQRKRNDPGMLLKIQIDKIIYYLHKIYFLIYNLKNT